MNAGDAVRHLSRDELEAAPLRLVVEEDAGDRVQAEAFAIVDGDPVAVHLRDAVRAPRVERRELVLRRLLHLAEHLARAGLVEPRLRGCFPHRLEHPGDAERGELASQYGLGPGGLHEALRGEIVDLARRCIADRIDQRVLVEEVGGHQVDLVDEVRDPFIWRGGATAYDPDNAVAFAEEQFGQVRAVLAGYSGDEGGRRRSATRATPRGARCTLPAWRQRVHTFTLVIVPSTTTRATCRLGFQTRRVRLLACDTLLPKATPRSHMKQRFRLICLVIPYSLPCRPPSASASSRAAVSCHVPCWTPSRPGRMILRVGLPVASWAPAPSSPAARPRWHRSRRSSRSAPSPRRRLCGGRP